MELDGIGFSAHELIDQKGDRAPHAGDGGDGHDGAEADFRGAGLSGFSCLGDSFCSGGGGLGVHGVSPMLKCVFFSLLICFSCDLFRF
jgi:hypothetical protein